MRILPSFLLSSLSASFRGMLPFVAIEEKKKGKKRRKTRIFEHFCRNSGKPLAIYSRKLYEAIGSDH